IEPIGRAASILREPKGADRGIALAVRFDHTLRVVSRAVVRNHDLEGFPASLKRSETIQAISEEIGAVVGRDANGNQRAHERCPWFRSVTIRRLRFTSEMLTSGRAVCFAIMFACPVV